MGTQKLLLPLGGKPVITRVVEELLQSSVEQVLVVIGRDGKLIQEVIGDREVQFVPNPDPSSDMLGSVRCGLRALPVGCEAVLVAMGDQPAISHELVSEMIRRFRDNEFKIIVPMYEGRRGHPVLFSARFCEEVLSRHDGSGLRGLLEAHPEEMFKLAVSSRAALEDMDTPADYQRQEKSFANPVTQQPARRCARSN
jgi:molybdenum cofactor cytidylyltransferase